MPITQPRTWRSSARRGSLSVVLWAFGFATTLLLVGLWGRAVTHDAATVEDTARTVIDADIAGDRVVSWIEDGVAATADIDPATAEQVIAGLSEHPEIEAALDSVVGQLVGALFSAGGESASVELTDTLAPVVPLVAAELHALGTPVDEAALTKALVEAETIDLETGEVAEIARVVEDARALLSLVVVLATLALMVTGAGAVVLAEDRPGMVRTLATRIILSALSFAVLFRIGSWVLDPDGGGSPIAGGGSILLGSNVHVFVLAAIAGAGIAATAGWYGWGRRSKSTATIDGTESDSDTRELASV